MAHMIHECPEAPEGLIESLEKNYGWEEESKIPLNMDRHDKCPYCGMEADKMEAASNKATRSLSRRPNHFEQ